MNQNNNATAGATPSGVTAPAGVTPPVQTATSSGDRAKAFKNHGSALIAQMSDEDRAKLGSMSNTLTFVKCAGDPQKQQSKTTQGKAEPSHKVVGYLFKSSVDITVPFAPLKQGCTCPTDVEERTDREVKAGEVFVLNNVETAMLLGRPEYSGKASGEGGKVVTLTVKASKSSKNALLPVLRTPDGSIKDGMDLIATKTVGADGKDVWELKEFYKESYGAYYQKRTAVRSGKSSSSALESCVSLAAAFNEMYNKK